MALQRILHAITPTGQLVLNINSTAHILLSSSLQNPSSKTLLLSRQKSLNALTADMCSTIHATLLNLEASPDVNCVVLRSKQTPNAAFCAGGDVRYLFKAGRAGDMTSVDSFFRREYALNSLLGSLKSLSVVSIMDGVIMGGGAGLAMHGKYRIATENTLFAMPECTIGLHPDAGASHILPRLRPGLGMYLGLTGHRLKGRDVLDAGLASHFVSSNVLAKFIHRLETEVIDSDAAIDAILADFEDVSSSRSKLPSQHVLACFRLCSVEDIIAALEQLSASATDGSGLHATEVLSQLRIGAPTCVKVAHESISRGASMSLDECLAMEFRLSARCTRREDFYSGVASAVINKDRKPQWQPTLLSSVEASDIASFFEPLASDIKIAELDLSNNAKQMNISCNRNNVARL